MPQPRLRQVGRHGLPGGAQEAVGPVEVLVPVAVGEAVGGLGAGVGGPHQALLLLHQPQHVLGVVDRVDRAEPFDLLDKRRARPGVQQPVDRPGEQADPVPTQLDVRLLTRQQQEVLAREPPALAVKGAQLRQPVGDHFGGVPDVKLGQVDDVDAVGLEGLHERRFFQARRHPVRLVELLLLEEIEGVLDVVVAGEGLVPVPLRKAVAVREGADRLQGLGAWPRLSR